MKPLVKIMVLLGLVFATTFLFVSLTGACSVEDVTSWLERAKGSNPWYVSLIVILILAVDIFIAVPTLTTCILAGYFLGFTVGGLSASIGIMAAGAIGYWLSRMYGSSFLKYVIPSETKRGEAKIAFEQYGLPMILLSRSTPILSEVCACMAGITKMRFTKFYVAWSVNSIPYAFIAAYSGSISSLENPRPAIYTLIMMYMTLWVAWFIYKRRK
ncbi:VTT domain-containing protein [Ulvibacterium sp.]|uniref:TVP38/TMEM64 family protein n=1 Tax=Ulvibacterium sp. TaxID=2665914 RepID=UPI00260CDB56|nr:VTT domain-containing protein [Ulvibacterium sp.]